MTKFPLRPADDVNFRLSNVVEIPKVILRVWEQIVLSPSKKKGGGDSLFSQINGCFRFLKNCSTTFVSLLRLFSRKSPKAN